MLNYSCDAVTSDTPEKLSDEREEDVRLATFLEGGRVGNRRRRRRECPWVRPSVPSNPSNFSHLVQYRAPPPLAVVASPLPPSLFSTSSHNCDTRPT
jgi:hypothetical protein